MNIFSDKSALSEECCGISLLQRFLKVPLPRIHDGWVYRILQLDDRKVNKSVMFSSPDFSGWLNKWTWYKARHEVDSTCDKDFNNFPRTEVNWLEQELGRRKIVADWLQVNQRSVHINVVGNTNITSLFALSPVMKNASQNWMHLLSLPCFLATIIFSLGLLLAPIQAQAAYVATELITLPEQSLASLRGFNDNDEIVGSARINGRQRGVLLKGGAKQHLDGFMGTDNNTVLGINLSGQVVGAANTHKGMRAFRSQRATGVVNLAVPLGDTSSAAMSINKSGDAVGYSSGKKGLRAVIWPRNGGVKTLPTLNGSSSSRGLAINDKGDSVGISDIPPGPRAVLWTNDTVKDLGALPGDRASEALSINSKGDIVGSSGDPIKQLHAVLWSAPNATIIDLGILPGGTSSRALSINNQGEVVGTATSKDGNRAFLWTSKNGIQDLNNMLTSRSGFLLVQAVGINNSGHIVAIGVDDHGEGEKHDHDLQARIFKLVPEP